MQRLVVYRLLHVIFSKTDIQVCCQCFYLCFACCAKRQGAELHGGAKWTPEHPKHGSEYAYKVYARKQKKKIEKKLAFGGEIFFCIGARHGVGVSPLLFWLPRMLGYT